MLPDDQVANDAFNNIVHKREIPLHVTLIEDFDRLSLRGCN